MVEIVPATEGNDSSKVTVSEVASPHCPLLITTLYFVPVAGKVVVLLVMVNVAPITPA